MELGYRGSAKRVPDDIRDGIDLVQKPEIALNDSLITIVNQGGI